MNPQQQSPVDYLNQIAPQAPKTSLLASKKRIFILIGILLVVGVIILSVALSALSASRKEPWERLSARLSATSVIANSSTGLLKNTQLRSANSSIKIFLTNTQRDLAAPLLTADVDSKKMSPSVVAEESSTAMAARLEDARLNAKYDSTYAREMNFQLSNVLTLLKQLYASSSNTTNKEFLDTTYNNLAPIQQSLADFSASNE